MTLLTVENLSVSLRGRPVLHDISLRAAQGEVIGLIGPNGAGKTTLMRAILGLVPHRGRSSLSDLPARARARAAAWMPQARDIAWPVSVETLVMLGRTPHLAPGQPVRPEDQAAVDRAITRMELHSFRQRPATELSGGEQARVLIARALAQETPLLMVDEPTAGLDPAHQIATLQVFSALARDGRSVIVSLHDLGLAVRHCTRLIVVDAGRVKADGPPGAVLTPELLRDTFHISAWFHDTADGPVFQPLKVVK